MDATNFANLLIAGIYYVLAGIISFLAIFSVYIFIRYGRSVVVTLTVNIVFIIIFLSILNSSYQTLHAIL